MKWIEWWRKNTKLYFRFLLCLERKYIGYLVKNGNFYKWLITLGTILKRNTNMYTYTHTENGGNLIVCFLRKLSLLSKMVNFDHFSENWVVIREQRTKLQKISLGIVYVYPSILQRHSQEIQLSKRKSANTWNQIQILFKWWMHRSPLIPIWFNSKEIVALWNKNSE